MNAVVNHKEFAERLKLACERNKNVPEFGKGQQVWFRDRLGVSQEAVRKWFEGVTKPKPRLLTQMAHLLDVDEAWLAVGKAPEMTKRETRQYKDKAEAAEYFVLSLFMMAGYGCAFSEGEDSADFYAIRAGKKLSVSVKVARPKNQTTLIAPVSNDFEQLTNITVVPKENYEFDILLMDHDGVRSYGVAEGAMYHVEVKTGKTYTTGNHVWADIRETGLI